MLRSMLVNRLDSSDVSDTKRCIVVQVGSVGDTVSEINAVLKENSDILDLSTVIYNYSGFSVCLPVKHIPKLLRALLTKGIDVYTVFEKYNP